MSISLKGERRRLSGQSTLEQAPPQLQTLRGTIKIMDFKQRDPTATKIDTKR